MIGTHGRGFWIMDNITALRQMTPAVMNEQAHLFEIEPAYRYLPVQVLSPHRPVRAGIQFANAEDTVAYEDRAEPSGEVERVFLNAGENPPGGVAIDYELKAPTGEVKLAILDGKGVAIREFSNQGKENSWMPSEPGMNRFVWDMEISGCSTAKFLLHQDLCRRSIRTCKCRLPLRENIWRD